MTAAKKDASVKGMPSVKEVLDSATRTQRPVKVKASVKISVKPGAKAK